MKIDRLLAITIYLLNHKRTSASVLARQFEVSLRTIQRDIETLCLAGIPVTAEAGTDGGYEILDTFSMKRQAAAQIDYAKIVTALEAFTSATGDKEAQSVLEKMRILSEKDAAGSQYAVGKEIIVDLNPAQKGTNISEKLSVVRNAVRADKQLSFYYTNAQGISKVHVVEPVYAVFQWYAWYLIAWYEEKQAYCMFKLVRMEQPALSGTKCMHYHNPERVRMVLSQQENTREYFDMTLLCIAELFIVCREYLNASVVEKRSDGSMVLNAHLPKDEHWWYGFLLGLGTGVTVLEPAEIRDKIRSDCEKLYRHYS